MTNPLVSTIVPVYNGERFLGEALDSIFAQDYRPIEVIVIDDGSTDNTSVIARSYVGVRYFRQDNRGQAAAMNVGLGAANGQFVAFLDADDIWDHTKLTVQVAYLLEHPEVDCVLVALKIFTDDDASLPERATKDLLMDEGPLLALSALVARKAAFERLGGFHERFEHAKDVDWFVRARDAGVKVTVMPEVLLSRRLHGANRSYRHKARTTEFMQVLNSADG